MKNFFTISALLSQSILYCWASAAGLADDVSSAASDSNRYASSYRGEFPKSSDGAYSGERDDSNVPVARKANFEPAFVPPSGAGGGGGGETTSIQITSRGNHAAASSETGQYDSGANNEGGESQEARIAFPAQFPYGDEGGSKKEGGADNGGYADPNLQSVQHYVPGKGYTAVKVNRYEPKADSYAGEKQPAYYPPAYDQTSIQQHSNDDGSSSIKITTQPNSNYDQSYAAPKEQGDDWKPSKEDNKPVDPNAEVYVPGKGYTKGLGYLNEYGPWSPGYGLQPNPNDKDDGKPPPNSENDPFYHSPPGGQADDSAAWKEPAHVQRHVGGGGGGGSGGGGEDNGQWKPDAPKKQQQQLSIFIKPAASYVGGYGGGERQQQALKPKANYEPAFSPPSGAAQQYKDYSNSGGTPASYGGSRNDYARRNDDEDGATASYKPFYDKYDKKARKEDAEEGNKGEYSTPPKYGPGSDENKEGGEEETPVINKRNSSPMRRNRRRGRQGRPVFGYMGNGYAPGISSGAYSGGPTSFGLPSSGGGYGLGGGGSPGGYGIGSSFSVDRPYIFKPDAPMDVVVRGSRLPRAGLLRGRRGPAAASAAATADAVAGELLLAALTNPEMLGL